MAPNSGDDFIGDDIFTGFWINHSHAHPYGATLTLDRKRGGFLIAFLALYVGLSGRNLWKIVRFSLHSFYSTTADTDGVYHQRQNILKNAKAAPDAAADIFWVMLAWRKRAQRPVARLIVAFVAAVLVSGGFIVSGIFSSRVVSNDSNEVMLKGSGCATVVEQRFEAIAADYLEFKRRRRLEHLDIALQCYQSSESNNPKCHTFTKARLPYTVDANATCPFDEKVCRLPSGNVLLDTGSLDSLDDLGINGGPRFQYRMSRHCAPLITTEDYASIHTDPDHPGKRTMRYHYGWANNVNVSSDDDNNYIYEVPIREKPNYLDSRDLFRTGATGYTTGVIPLELDETSQFNPIPELEQPSGAPVVLIFLDADGLWYREKNKDPWFAASQEVPISKGILGTDTEVVYLADEPAGVVGCVSRSWISKPGHPEIESSNWYNTTDPILAQTWPDDFDRAAIMGFLSTLATFLVFADGFYSDSALPSLLSRFTIFGGVSQAGSIPSNRWQQEMEYTFQAALASIQSNMVAATQRGAMWFIDSPVCPTPEACQALCHHQKVRSPDFYSFSVLGVSIILCVGLCLLLVATWIESIGALILRCSDRSRSKGQPSYAMLEWEHNSALQLQRLAHEAVGSGVWSRTAQMVPVTEPGDRLGTLDISDPKHTRLRRHASSYELGSMDLYSSRGLGNSNRFGAMKKISSDTLDSRYYGGTSVREGEVDDGLSSPGVVRGREGFTVVRTRASPTYAKVATQEDA